MQKTANLGIATGLVLGAAGAPFGLLGASVFALPVFYNVKTELTGAKKIGMCLAAGAMSIFTLALGGAVGNSITGKQFQDTSTVTTPTISSPTTTPVATSTPAPVAQPTVSTEPNPIIAKVERQNNAPASELNRPKNGGTTTLAQKCEALRAFSGDFGKSAEIGFQIGFEHELGTMSTDTACSKVGVPL